MLRRLNVPRDPVQITQRLGGAADDVKFGGRHADDGQVALERAAVIEQTGIDSPAKRDIHIVAAKPLQNCERVPAFENVLGKSGLVEDGHILTGRAMLSRVASEPVLATERIFHDGFDAIAGEPIGAFPAVPGAEASAGCGQPIVQRTSAQAASGFEFAIRPGHLVVQSQNFRDAFPEKSPVVGPGTKAPDVHRP